MMCSPEKGMEQNMGVKDDLMSKLESDDFDDINDAINPQSLGRCKTNVLFTAFKVSGFLQDKARQERPDVEELKKLANSVDEFTTSLIDSLKSDKPSREAFGDSLDSIIDKAIEYKQMKFISHPVVYNLLDKRWIGQFYAWKSFFWIWILLWLWCFLEVILFPFILAIFFVRDKAKLWIRKYQDSSICFILHAEGKSRDQSLNLMTQSMSRVIHQCGVRCVNYCVISSRNGEAYQHVAFQKQFDNECSLVKEILAMERDNKRTRATIDDDVHEAGIAFVDQTARKKILFIFTNDTSSLHDQPRLHGKLDVNAKKLKKELGVKIVPIAIGDSASVDDLREVASMPDRAISCRVSQDPSNLGRKLLRVLYGASFCEMYLDYYVTPYFIFARDTLSYFSLLGLHVAICLSPSANTFTMVEWAILVFFVGRLALELDQCFESAPKDISTSMQQQATRAAHVKIKTMASRMLNSYLSDRWNVLDLITLVIYFGTFILRIITWGISTSVPGNRPLVVAQYLYGLNATILTFRVFGSLLEANKGTGITHIALVRIVEDVAIIFVQFFVGILACSLAMTKVLLAEHSFRGGDEGVSRSEGLCSGTGFSCWWEIVKHLGWTLLGIADVDPFTSSDSLSNYIAQTLYAGFIITALILLVNMMIAVLSSTYERVENNSLREWSLRKAIIIRTFSNYHPIPVPLNLISQLAKLLLKCIKACRRRYGSRRCYTQIPDSGNTSEEDTAGAEKDRNLEGILEKLKAVYFSTHGSGFPLTDESKISNMLIETRRNREMCNQIARKVFFNQSQNTKVAPVGPDAWNSAGIQIEGCLFTYVGRENCKFCNLEAQNFHGAAYRLPFSENFPKLEVLIQEDGRKRELVVGVVRANHKLHKSAGESCDTIGYYTSDGHLLDACEKKETKSGQPVEDKMAYRGDLIICLVDFDKLDEESRVRIDFTLNGALIHKAWMKYEKGKKELYPFIGMCHKGIRVLAKVCSGTNDMEDSAIAVAKLKESNDAQFQDMQQRIADICETIVFSNQTSAEGVATTGPNAWVSAGIQIDGCLLTYIGRDLCKTCKFETKDFHGARYKQPFSESFPKLEVLIKAGGNKRELAVGVVRIKHNLHESAGESDDTVGYHASDGRIRNSCEKKYTGVVQLVEGKMAFQGDSIACIVEFGKFENGRVPVVFTLNGETIYEVSMKYEKGKRELYPFIGMGHNGIRVLAKVCTGKSDEGTSSDVLSRAADSIAQLKETNDFQFQNLHQRIADVVEEKQREREGKIDSISNSLSEVLQIVRDMNVKTSSV